MRQITQEEMAELQIGLDIEGIVLDIIMTSVLTVEADLQGNIFYTLKHSDHTHTKPLGICIPEFADIPQIG